MPAPYSYLTLLIGPQPSPPAPTNPNRTEPDSTPAASAPCTPRSGPQSVHGLRRACVFLIQALERSMQEVQWASGRQDKREDGDGDATLRVAKS
jgi:hypothetical protein